MLQAKLDVYPLENYILRPLDGPLAAVLAGSGGSGNVAGSKSSGSSSSSHHAAAATTAAAEQRRRVKTPLEKLVTLKNRVQVERQPVQSVEGVCVVHLHGHPHVLLLRQTLRRNRDAAGPRVVAAAQTNPDVSYRLPGGRCRRGEAEEACLLRKLGRCLLSEAKQPASASSASAALSATAGSVVGATATTANTALSSSSSSMYGGSSSSGAHRDGLIVGDTMAMDAAVAGGGGAAMAVVSEASAYFRVGDVLARWYRPHYSPLVYPYVPPHLTAAAMKEVRSVYVVHLEPMAYLRIAHADVELVAVPLFDLHDNAGKYGPVLAAVPTLLSRLVINYCHTEY